MPRRFPAAARPAVLSLETSMARSLTVKQEEKASTTPLFTVFLVLAGAWMAAAAWSAASAESAAAAANSLPFSDGQ
jgi:hypothetical protein